MADTDAKLTAATLAARAGRAEPPSDQGVVPHTEPLVQTSVYDFPTIAASLPALSGEGGYVYARNGLPNERALGDAVAVLEGAESGVATASGMGAIAAAVIAHSEAGTRVVVQRDAYGGTAAMFESDLAHLGIAASYVDAYDPNAVAMAADGASMVIVESISNPLLREVDVATLADVCRARNALLVVDNTFATPLGRSPLADGADLVVHSVTKFLGGHHDLCAGALVGAAALVEPARGVAIRMGLLCAPFPAWLALRGIRTLDVRMQRAWATAEDLADRLRGHDAVVAVHAAERCALVTFDVGSYENAERLVERMSLITLSPSLGGATTTASHPTTSSHRALNEEQLIGAGITQGMIRLSVGLEHPDDLWRDLSHALKS